jgi:hypothetical protein
VTRFVAIYLLVAILAALAAAATWLLAPPAIAPVAVASAVLTAVSLALTIRSALVDRADLRADIHDGYYGISDNAIIEVRLYNAGRRPIKVEDMGFAARRPERPRFINWFTWSKADPSLPVTLAESESAKFWTWPTSVATTFLKQSPPTLLHATDHLGAVHWFKLPVDIVEAVRREFATAQAQRDKALAEKAAKEQRGEPPVDDYGQPIGAPE